MNAHQVVTVGVVTCSNCWERLGPPLTVDITTGETRVDSPRGELPAFAATAVIGLSVSLDPARTDEVRNRMLEHVSGSSCTGQFRITPAD